VLVANKCERGADLPGIAEAARLGFGEPIPVSAWMQPLAIGETSSMLVTLTDLSVHRRAEETAAAERFARSILEQATDAILTRRRDGTPTVTYTFVVGPENCHEVPDFVALARRRGVTSVSFIPLTGCYDGARAPSADDLRGMDAAVAWLRAAKAGADDPDFIDNSDAYLALFPRAFRGLPSPLRCHVGYFNVIVDCYGNVYPCVLHYELHRPAANVLDVPLRELWYSAAYERRRSELTACTDCYWNCHTEMNLLYQRVPAAAPTPA